MGKVYQNIRRKEEVISKAYERGDDSVLSECKKDLNMLLQDEEVMWRQRSKALWLREGDRNSKFFHAIASRRRVENTIQKLLIEDGNYVYKQEEIETEIIGYFQRTRQLGMGKRKELKCRF